MKKAALALVLITSLVLPAPASAGGEVTFDTNRARYRDGVVVTLTFHNGTRADVTMENPWVIENRRTGDTESIYIWPDDQLVVGPGEDRVWRWEQNDGGCYGQCENIQYGDPVGAGKYLGIARTTRSDYGAPFDIGEFFTLGFTSRPHIDFVTYVNTPEEVAQMRVEVEASAEDKQIVSGIVRWGRRYNPDWNFTMAPGSIVLGDVFIEVCDGSPFYVQRHRKEWLGQRWCPWSSYVEKVGR
jgi:hypothetical protein